MREPTTDEAPPHTDAARTVEAHADEAGAQLQPVPRVNTYELFGVKRLWSFVAGLCLLAALVLGWRNHLDATFVAATLGVVAWFLDQRNLLRARSIEANAEQTEDEEIDDEQ